MSPPAARPCECSGGTLGGILPLLAIFYAVMLQSWNGAVDDLADHYDPSHVHRVSVAGSIDDADDEELPELEESAPQPTPAAV